MSDIIYPTIDLFIYDLKNSLNATDEENHKFEVHFRKKLPKKTKLVDPDIEIEYLELLPKQQTIDFVNQNRNLEGYYYPVRLNDTYGLQIDCSVDNLTDSQPLKSFSFIKEEIEAKLRGKTGSIGQTWMLSGCLPKDSRKSTQEVAKYCYDLFVKDANLEEDLKERGRLFEGEFFEFWQYQPSQEINLHIIVVIYPSLQSMEKAAELYNYWIGLFSYKHKILFAYTQSRLLKKNLIKYYQKIEENKRGIEQNKKIKTDKKIKEVENIIETYMLDLPKLNFQKQIVDLNLINYKNWLEIIKNKTLESDNLQLLDKFSKLSTQKYIVQIEKDYENMELGLRLLESNINIIRSRIEAEKAKSDRSFQNLVTVVGTGTALMALIDDEGKKCNAITEVIPNQLIVKVCNDPLGKFIGFPIIMIFVLGCLGLVLKGILSKLS
ncbi:hypothetical protein [Crocosphaera watsonii]|uniref:Uncharacterized protein n=1 Tax=Crocosphaera watsonii WH 0401 TaxID=555881 RepID=T2JEQ9_CROWT|nr:hypothetical protein [Crocosphaera watsonii]CCQ62952.1 hypothetical protein CWATWH0401_4390 [Crocosphaera watsonii WH 0401]